MPYELVAIFEQGEWILLRGIETASSRRVFAVTTTHGESARLRRSWELRDELDPDGSLRPLAYELLDGRHHLVLPDPGGQLLAQVPVPLDPRATLAAGAAIADALARFHARGFVHRDIKPSTILYDAAKGRAWLAGTGLSLRISRAGRLNEPSEQMVGTPAYMAPEQTGRMNWPVDTRSDMYSLGVVLYQLLTGTVPFDDPEPLSVIHAHIARTPDPPHVRRAGIPEIVSNLVSRLLSKDPRERYQTAAGVARDLRRCLPSASFDDAIPEFPLGEHDVSSHVRMPDRIFGHEAEIATIELALAGVSSARRPALLLVGGESGIGKSALVDEALRRQTAAGTPISIATGKLDALGRGTPLATLGRALAALLPELHADEALAAAVRTAVAPHGRLLLGLLPELATFFQGEPEPPEVSPQEAQLRFHHVVRAFVGAFARPEHPLALFLDDIQWVDAATLAVARTLLSDTHMRSLLVIAAYRVNEVEGRVLAELERAAPVSDRVTLASLTLPHVSALIGNMIARPIEEVAPLAELVFAKTAGNPFFTIHFVLSLVDEHLLAFDADGPGWRWDLATVEARGFTDNVVDMMLAKVDRLPECSRASLVHLAFLGDAAPPAVLAAAIGVDSSAVHGEILPAVRAGLVALTTSAYVFLHDRIRESAYQVVAEPRARAALHRRIGERLFAANLPGTLFDVFRQLARGVSVASDDSGVRDAMVAVAAAKEAKSAAAYAAANECVALAAARLPRDAWTTHHGLAFEIGILHAECALFLGEIASAAARLSDLSSHVRDVSDRAVVTRLLMNAHNTLGRADLAIGVCREYLATVDIEWPLHPTDADIEAEVARMHRLVGGRPLESLVDLPLIEDVARRNILDQVLVDCGAPALYFDRNLWQLSLFGTINFALVHGISPAMAWIFAVAAMVFATVKDDPDTGRRFARLAQGLSDRFADHTFSARAFVTLRHHVFPWVDDCRKGDATAGDMSRAKANMQNGGELIYLAYAYTHMVTHSFANGLSLQDVEEEAAAGRALATKANIGYVVTDIDQQLALVRMLRGRTENFGKLDDAGFRESDFEGTLRERGFATTLAARYWIRKLVARYFVGDFLGAVAAAEAARPLLWSSGGPFGPHFRENADYHFFGALALAASQRAGAARELEEHRARFARWATTAPITYGSRAAVIEAELVRLEGGDAGLPFERAIALARESGFVHHEALVLEVAARYWAGRGFVAFAETYRGQACAAYRRWGAEGKARDMESRFPEIRAHETTQPARVTVEQPVDQLDLATALAVSETVASELVHERLVEGLLSMALKTAGAESAVLLLRRDGQMVTAAEAVTLHDGVRVELRREGARPADFCKALVDYVASAGLAVVLDDAASFGPFLSEPYVVARRCRSLACIPLVRRGALAGLLYFENNLVARAFTARRLISLKLIATQAAGALENARLYADLSKARAAEEALQQTREALAHLARVATLGELTASIGHELTQPLTAIVVNSASCVRWLKAGKVTEGTAAVVRLGRDAEHAMEVIQRLRSLFKKQGAERTSLDLNDAVAEVVALTRSEMTRNDIAAELDLAPDVPCVLANRVQIQQVVMNLILNAIQATRDVHDRPRRILIRTSLLGADRVRTVVSDSGIGVPKENASALFEPFFSTKRDGMGVGLSISRSIVASHGGELWHASGDGPGATFGFDLSAGAP